MQFYCCTPLEGAVKHDIIRRTANGFITTYFNEGGNKNGIGYTYCPFCGRKLSTL
jgi:hypothetical protein